MYKDKCGTCKYWGLSPLGREAEFKRGPTEDPEKYTGPHQFDCTRYPPTPIRGNFSLWPKTGANEECGEYKPIPEPNYSYLITMAE